MATIANLNVRLSAQIAEFQSEFKEAAKSAQKFAGEFEGIATRAAAVGTFLGNIASDIAGSMARALGQALKDAVRLSSEFANAFIGLSSVARAFGADADLAQASARRLASDGLLPLKDAATGLKNLLAAGFNLDQSIKLMDAFKDAAAFGRAGALSFGDAVRTATEGVKNGNSILVDNAGITKNLSNILKEAGFKAADLSRVQSDAAVRLALYNGILKESIAFSGDAARLTQTYAGQVARLTTAYETSLATIGTAITQNATVAKAIGTVSDALLALNTRLVNNRNAFNIVSDGVILFARAMQGVIVSVDLVLRAVNAMDTGLKTLVNAFANANLAIVSMLVSVAKIASQLPGGATALGVFGREITQLVIAQDAFSRIAKSSADDIRNNAIRVENWGGVLGDAKGRLATLITELEKTRGKTVELGNAATTSGRAIGDSIDAGSTKAAKALAKLRQFYDDLFPGVKEGLTSLPGIRLPKPTIPDLVVPSFDDLSPRQDLGIGSAPGIQFDKPDVDQFITDLKTSIAQSVRSQQPFMSLVDASKDAAEDIAHKLSSELTKHLPQPLRDNLSQVFAGAITAVKTDGLRGLIDFGKQFAKDFAIGAATELANSLPPKFKEVALAAIDAFKKGGLAGLVAFGKEYAKQFAADFIGEFLAAVPVIGGALKQLARPFVDFIADIFGSKGRDMVKDFAASFGGFDALQRRLEELGPAAAGLWERLTQGVGRNNPEQAQSAIDAINAAFARQKEIIADLAAEYGPLFEGLISKATGSGQLLDSAMVPFIDKLRDAGAITGELAGKLLGLTRENSLGWKEMEELAKKYGVALSGLGATFQQQKISEIAGNIIRDFDRLIDNGADFNAVLHGFTDEIQGVVTESLKFGTEIPGNMRPWIEKLIEAKRLIGDNGEAITDIDKLKFGPNIKSDMDRLIEAIKELIEKIGTGLPRAITDLAAVRVPSIKVPVVYELSGEGFDPRGVPAFGDGAIVRRPTLALVGESGPEAVVPLSQLSTVSPEVGTTTAIIEMEGQVLAEIVVPHLPGVVRRYVAA